jgi:hypothetical protein
MSDQPRPHSESLSPSRLQRVDEVCDRFENAWKAGQRPRIEDYLAGTVEGERAALLRGLIVLDTDCRRQAGEQPQAEEYHARFPFLDLEQLAKLLRARRASSTVETQPRMRQLLPRAGSPADDHDRAVPGAGQVSAPGAGGSRGVRCGLASPRYGAGPYRGSALRSCTELFVTRSCSAS